MLCRQYGGDIVKEWITQMSGHERVSEKPVVALEPSKLLGLRQIAAVNPQVKATRAGSADPGGQTDLSPAEAGRLLSKIGEVRT
jgi:hypothetical protein